ncbi:F-box SKIP23-like protein (DUF295) [Rhynchospora pubera]|uniref:F-box SKIP23-like protein (DUF295) n=1 Tax=Rhynchospora pubera TaxID=906938 RepID=A0AAV8CG74_9POAL|nr:F-box SKIP23-like protein (DUF295) [Rhynchospora pubera]
MIYFSGQNSKLAMARLLCIFLPKIFSRIKRKNTRTMSKRNWQDLPPELLFLISQKLTDLCYFIRFRAVCKTWRSSVPLSDQPPQIPWLVEYNESLMLGTCLKEKLRFHCLASPKNKTGSVPIKESHRGKKYLGPGNGYLLVRDGHELYLFNPLTNNTIFVPPLPFSRRFFWPVFSCSDPMNWHLVLNQFGNWYCGIYQPDKMQWKYVESDFVCTCFWNGMLFTASISGCTQAFDATSGKKLYEIPPPNNEDPSLTLNGTYLVESCGLILRVCLVFHAGFAGTPIFHIYRLNFERGKVKSCWVEVKNMGDQILFLDSMNVFSVTAPAGFKANCIYFMSVSAWNTRDLDWYNTLWRYDIATGKVEHVPCPFERFMWFIPKLC